MALAQLLAEPELTKEQRHLRDDFFDESGYGSDDLLSLNYGTKTFLTKNGGKYQLHQDQFVRLAGPPIEVEERY